jgi:hypothetical protein
MRLYARAPIQCANSKVNPSEFLSDPSKPYHFAVILRLRSPLGREAEAGAEPDRLVVAPAILAALVEGSKM